ncbi:MAG: hypothetical protein ABSA83_13765 [Verrucomicrobiota bacterium]
MRFATIGTITTSERDYLAKKRRITSGLGGLLTASNQAPGGGGRKII